MRAICDLVYIKTNSADFMKRLLALVVLVSLSYAGDKKLDQNYFFANATLSLPVTTTNFCKHLHVRPLQYEQRITERNSDAEDDHQFAGGRFAEAMAGRSAGTSSPARTVGDW